MFLPMLGMLLLGTGLMQAQAMDCTVAAFQGLNLTDGTDWVNGQPVPGTGKPVTITSATLVAATVTVPAFCDVIGTMWPTITFEVALPTTTTWNQRLMLVGNGGKAGTIPKDGGGSIVAGVQLGYAATGTDTGHCSAGCPPGTQAYPGSTFAYVDYPTPGANPYWYEKLVDFAYLSMHETIVVAKQMVQAYYSEPPAYTYYVGCSTGGRQGLMEAQRYPTDFNGILAGSPVNAYMARR